MKIKWYAHATLLVEGDGRRIITDPYTPRVMGFASVTETADIVIRSSADDDGHNYAEMIGGDPVVVTATEIGPEGTVARGLHVVPIPAQESLIYKETPADNAMYRFTVEGIAIAHFGDVGNRLDAGQLAALAGAEVLLVPAGGPPTIDLDDLRDAIVQLAPRLVIPMHYALPGSKVNMLPIAEFVARFEPDQVQWHDSSEIEVSRASLPQTTTIVVLQPSTA